MASLLDSAESVFRLVVEEAKEYAILLLDPSGRIESWNPGAPATGTGNRQPALLTFRDRSDSRARDAQIIRGRDQNLRAAHPG